jgi:predicted AlkP superfamily pyrophosphatase or phosphodiesterase
MKRLLVLPLLFLLLFSACVKKPGVERPKLVVGLVIDQMRWDYLYRYADKYGNDGFKRLLREGFSCENTMINYLPANTGPGHTCIYTGSVPSIHGIAGNNWIDDSGKRWYCVDDSNYHSVFGNTAMSPNTMITTTITDELKLATNFNSRVFGVAIKDRGSILPAGHLGNGAYYYNDTLGIFTTSNFYPKKYQNPGWLQAFNKRKLPDSLTKLNWLLLYPKADYTQSFEYTAYSGKLCKAEKIPAFPHIIDTLDDTNRYAALKTMPAGNTYTLEMAKGCAEGEQLGKGDYTDFLAVSLSSTDYMGHTYGPNSLEAEDMYLRLDKDIAAFLHFLDGFIGHGNYLLFLSADHGAAHNGIFLKDKDVPADVVCFNAKLNEVNRYLAKSGIYTPESIAKNKDTTYSLVDTFLNYQVFLNNRLINQLGFDREKIKEKVMYWLGNQAGITYVIDMEHIERAALPEPIHTMLVNGYNRRRSGCIQYIMDPNWYDYGYTGITTTGTTHSSWNPYDSHIPLIFYGWHIQHGETHTQTNMTDISPTLAALLHIQMPNGCIGKPITDVLK